MKQHCVILLGIMLAASACNSPAPVESQSTLFTSLPASETGIDFQNDLSYNQEFNVYTYRNFYNGGGVALGDVNNDGLIDVYFSGNMVSNRLYLNKGNFQFEDITDQAGVACEGVWSTGVSMADVNGDGWLDIYVCKSGNPAGEHRYNELFINNGDLTFSEQANQWNIDDKGFSTHAAFFDMDKDGDLDCYLLNNSFRPIGEFDLRKEERSKRDSLGGNKLYRNDNGRFTDISEEAGIYGSIIGFGLGVTVGDVNRDGWQDIYVSNDFFERDYLYINNQDGTFSETLEESMREISAASMGADMADINNDGYPEVFVTDMLPEGDARMKTKTTFEDWNKYQANLKNGYYHQFTRNVLQLNNGPSDPEGNVTFSEIGRMLGVHATDWSWGALITDLDNNGRKDIFVANGIYQDLTDQDFLHYIGNPYTAARIVSKEGVDFEELINAIPTTRIPNYAFSNEGNLAFENKADEWGLGIPSHSNGTAYGDLDNDGDLDLIINNVNMAPFVMRSSATTKYPDRHYLQFELKGEGQNQYALGTQIAVRHQGQAFFMEHMPVRGFQSTMDQRPHLGLGELEKVDTVLIRWPNDTYTLLKDVKTDQLLSLSIAEGKSLDMQENQDSGDKIFADVSNQITTVAHKENGYQDFDRDRLIYHMISSEGPKVAVADVNADGREDFYIGGSAGYAGKLMIQQANGRFRISNEAIFEEDKASEDIECLFFDADGDGDQDLYVASGGNEFSSQSIGLIDRLYLNNGSGSFQKDKQTLPGRAFGMPGFASSSCVDAADYDQDGDLDLFVGIRLVPGLYGFPVHGNILNNDGKGKFTNVTASVVPDMAKLGMITDAYWEDIDQDNDPDLIVIGEWMPITVFKNENGKLSRSEQPGLAYSSGYWNCMKAGDFDRDGDIDFVVGNHGRNTRFKASPEKPVSMYINDFDQNGTPEQVVCVYNGEGSYPLALRHDLVKQMPGLNRKYIKYENYVEQTITDIFTPQQLEKAIKLEVYNTESSLLINDGNGQFSLKSLPVEAQLSPVYGLMVQDFDKDGQLDILLGGNFHRAKPEVGIYDANYGVYLRGNGKGDFLPVKPGQSGFFLKGEVRDMQAVKVNGREKILVAMNNQPIRWFEYE
ncbi:MAG: VCBS repeat-containing protein [Bacteroidota bacterium]